MRTIIALLLLMISSSAFAEPRYVVKADVLDEAKLLGSPTLVLESGIATSASVDGSYRLSIVVSPAAGGRAFLETVLEVGNETHSPSMMVDFGKESRITIGSSTLIVLVSKV